MVAEQTGVGGAEAELHAATARLAEDASGGSVGEVASRYDTALQRWLRLGGPGHEW